MRRSACARNHWQTGPPLTRWTLLQGKLLGEALDLPVYVGMRNWHPYIADVMAEMKRDGVCGGSRAICLAPQNSRTSVGLYRRAAAEASEALGLEMEFVAGWSEHPLLAQAFALKLWPAWAEACAVLQARAPVLFTAHAVPCRTIMSRRGKQRGESEWKTRAAGAGRRDSALWRSSDAGPVPRSSASARQTQ